MVGADDATIGGNSGQGAAYVFTESGSAWANMTQTAKLTASDGVANDYFGSSVSISGSTLVVGAPNAPYSTTAGPGAAYVFVETGSAWTSMTETAKLTASDGLAGDGFGSSVSISGNTVVVGADAANSNQGTAYEFTKPATGWVSMTQSAELTASDAAAGSNFGNSISISGNTLVVGADAATIGSNSGQGATYVYSNPTVPVVTGISPTQGPSTSGTTVTITGTGLAGATAVDFGNTKAKIVTDTATKIVVTSPVESAGTVDVTVFTANGTSAVSAADQFTYLAAPVFSSLSAPSIAYGTATTILSGTISLVPDSESVSITVNGVQQSAVVTGGAFSSSFNTSARLSPAHPTRSPIPTRAMRPCLRPATRARP